MSILDSLKSIQGVIKNTTNASPGDYEIDICALTHGDGGGTYPFGNLVTGIAVFENIESAGITGYLDITDHVNLIQAGPLVGEELLQLKFSTAGTDDASLEDFSVDFTENPLYVFSIEQVNVKSDNTIDYRIHFCSPELIKDKRVRISKAYQGNVSDIVENILTTEIGTKKKITIEPTLGVQHYISPNLHPYDFIRDLAGDVEAKELVGAAWTPSIGSKSLSNEQVFKGFRNDFMFYESCSGLNFRPIGTPNMDSGLEFTINVSQTTSSAIGDGHASAMLRATEHSITSLGDKFRNLGNGTYGGKHIRHNGVTKSYAVYKSDYMKQLQKESYAHISKTPVYEADDAIKALLVSEYPDSRVRFSSTSSFRDTIINKNSGLATVPISATSPAHSLQRQMQLGHLLGSHRLNITLPGISGLRVGMGAYAELPEVGLGAGQKGLKDSEELAENRFDNYWVITKVSHIVNTREGGGNRAEYKCLVELANTMAMTQDPLPTYNKLAAASA